METRRNLEPIQRLALAQALYKTVAPQVKRGGGGLRDEVDAEFCKMYEQSGVTKRSIRIGGETVGSISGRMVPCEMVTSVYVSDVNCFADWLSGEGLPYLREAVAEYGDKMADLAVRANGGEVPPGVSTASIVKEEAMRTTLTVDMAAIGGYLADAVPSGMAELANGEVV